MTDYDAESLSRSNKYLAGDVDQEFERARDHFVLIAPQERIDFLRTYDAALEYSLDRKSYATRGDAQLLTQQRELSDIHFRMLRAGR